MRLGSHLGKSAGIFSTGRYYSHRGLSQAGSPNPGAFVSSAHFGQLNAKTSTLAAKVRSPPARFSVSSTVVGFVACRTYEFVCDPIKIVPAEIAETFEMGTGCVHNGVVLLQTF